MEPLKIETSWLINLKNLSNCPEHKPVGEAALLWSRAVPFWGSMDGQPGAALLSPEVCV